MQFRVKLLSSTALAAVAALAATSVSAQDVGALEKRVQALEKSGAGQYVSRSKKTMNLVVSGHVAQMMQMRDNGESSALIFRGNPESETRFRFVGTGKISDNVSVRTRIEVGETSSNTQRIDSNALTDDQATFNVRQMDIALQSKTMGTLSIGDASLATDGYHGYGDMSGTTLVQTAGGAMIGAEPFKNSAGANSGVTGGIFNNLDAARTDRVAYDSPRFAGFQFVTSYANEDNQNFGLNYGGDFGGVKVRAAVAHGTVRAATDVSTTTGSIGVLLPMGLNATISGASEDSDSPGVAERDRIYVKIGYQFTASEIGQTRLALAWGENDSGNATNDEGERWSIGLVQVIEPLGAEFYAAYHNFSAERTGVNIQDIDIVTAGMRVSF